MSKPNLSLVRDQGARRPLRILIADDDRDTGLTLATILRSEGHEVHVALRGDEVLQLDRLLRSEALILDVDMPGMSGYAVAQEVREHRGTLAPLLIAVSGKWKEPSERRLGRALGFDHYLVKPCDPREILALLKPLQRGASEAQGSAS